MARKLNFLHAITAASLLTACGVAAAPTMPPATPTTAIVATLAVQAPATQAPTALPTNPPTASPPPTPLAQAASPTASPTRILVTYKGIEQGITADGFPYLGRADAPITLTDYSDFL